MAAELDKVPLDLYESLLKMGADADDLFWRLTVEEDVRVPGGEDHVGCGHEDVCSSRDAKVVAREGAVGWEMDEDVAV